MNSFKGKGNYPLFGALRSSPEVINFFSCSTQLSMKFFLLINVKMPTIVGILTFMSRKNSLLHLSEPEERWISWYFYTYEHLKFHAQLSWVWKKFYNLGPKLFFSESLFILLLGLSQWIWVKSGCFSKYHLSFWVTWINIWWFWYGILYDTKENLCYLVFFEKRE